MPLFEQVYRVIHEGRPPREAIDELMSLPAGRDVPGFISREKRGAHRAPCRPPVRGGSPKERSVKRSD
jgi:hypothetical protein